MGGCAYVRFFCLLLLSTAGIYQELWYMLFFAVYLAALYFGLLLLLCLLVGLVGWLLLVI